MTMTQPLSLMRLSNIYKSFGDKKVLQGVCLDVKSRESLVIIGGSGSGKSVLIKCLLGLIIPDAGSIIVDGDEVIGASHRTLETLRKKISMLFQGSALFDSLTIWENVAFYLIHEKKMNRHQARRLAIEKLAAVGLAKRVADLFPSEISGGMQRRVALARAIIHDPQIVVFDEPTTGLDPIMANVIDDLILKCVRDIGATAITITHDIASACRISDRIAMLYEGKIIWNGPADTLYQANNPIVDQFIHGRTEGPINIRIR